MSAMRGYTAAETAAPDSTLINAQTPCDLLLSRKTPTIGTVHFNDVTTKSGAPNIDSECRLTRLRNYLNGVDLSKLSEEMIAPFETEPPPDDAVLVLRPTS